MVPDAMRRMIQDLQNDLNKAEVKEEGKIDPPSLAAKYYHTFVYIHPFLDGNGRMCPLILNSILLIYSGTLVSIGCTQGDRDDYMKIAVSASHLQQNPEHFDGIPEDFKSKFYKELAISLLDTRGTTCKRLSLTSSKMVRVVKRCLGGLEIGRKELYDKKKKKLVKCYAGQNKYSAENHTLMTNNICLLFVTAEVSQHRRAFSDYFIPDLTGIPQHM